MVEKTFTSVFCCLFVIALVGIANALTIDINAYAPNDFTAETLELEAGTYDVTMIGTADGGLYNAWWNPKGAQICANDAGCKKSTGWLNTYYIESSDIAISFGDNLRYPTSLQALANAEDTSFTLAATTIVSFGIWDTDYSDNQGGISLLLESDQFVEISDDVKSPVDPIPEPTTMFLFGTGLIGLAGVSRRKKK